MSAVETLRALASGARPPSGLLHTARLTAFGVEAYGEEAIVKNLRRAPFDLSDGAAILEVPGHLAIFDGEMALVADLCCDNIARIWLLGDGCAANWALNPPRHLVANAPVPCASSNFAADFRPAWRPRLAPHVPAARDAAVCGLVARGVTGRVDFCS